MTQNTLKQNWIILFFFCFANIHTYAQNSGIDIDKPVSDIDLVYSVSNNNLVFTLLLNNKDKSQNLSPSTLIRVIGQVEGQIVWEKEPTEPKEKIFFANFSPFSPSQNTSSFSYVADIKDGTGKMIPVNSKIKKLENVKIKLDIDGKPYEYNFWNLYLPTVIKSNQSAEQPTIKISTKGKIKDKRMSEITIESVPIGVPFEVTSLEIKKGNDKNTSSTSISGGALGQNRYANNGQISLPIKTEFDLDKSATYTIKAKGILIGTSNNVESKEVEVILIDDIPLKVINKNPAESITIKDEDKVMDNNIITEGNGELGMVFINPEFSKSIIVKRISNGGGNYSFELTGCNNITENAFSYFYYTANGIQISQPFLIEKKPPQLENFKFNGIKDNKISLDFILPKYVNKDKLFVSIVGKDGNTLVVSGSPIITRTESETKSKFEIQLSNELTQLVNKENVVDIRLKIIYDKSNLYDLGVTVVNQKVINEKISELNAEIAKKPKNRSNETIEGIVNSLVKIGEAVGNSITKPEINTAISELTNEQNGTKIKSTMQTIGKWATLAGKIILPLFI